MAKDCSSSSMSWMNYRCNVCDHCSAWQHFFDSVIQSVQGKGWTDWQGRFQPLVSDCLPGVTHTALGEVVRENQGSEEREVGADEQRMETRWWKRRKRMRWLPDPISNPNPTWFYLCFPWFPSNCSPSMTWKCQTNSILGKPTTGRLNAHWTLVKQLFQT